MAQVWVSGEMVHLEGGSFLMGADNALAYPDDGEGPVRQVELSPFAIDQCAVSNAQFAEMVDATGYVTEAERFGWSFVFAGLLPDDFPPTAGVAAAPWWRQVEGATWRRPEGAGSNIESRLDHPVIHVSWNDARAFAEWAGKQLPTEAEWEFAARGGLEQRVFPWGDEREPNGEHLMNVWQGEFPLRNTAEDGWVGTAPVDAFPPNAYGLHNMTGNVWEWCNDWFGLPRPNHSAGRDPQGPALGLSRVMRGGSYLCHDSYCRRYRVAARSSNSPDSSTGNQGFRCVVRAERD